MSGTPRDNGFMPKTGRPSQPVVLASYAFYTSHSDQAALLSAVRFFEGRKVRSVPEPSEPCPTFLGRPGRHSHIKGSLDIDGRRVPCLRRIQTYEMPVGHRPWAGASTTRIQVEMTAASSRLGDDGQARSAAATQAAADLEALRSRIGGAWAYGIHDL
jgi:hypothetical protein